MVQVSLPQYHVLILTLHNAVHCSFHNTKDSYCGLLCYYTEWFGGCLPVTQNKLKAACSLVYQMLLILIGLQDGTGRKIDGLKFRSHYTLT